MKNRWQKLLMVLVLVFFYGCVTAQETRKSSEPPAVKAKTSQVPQPATVKHASVNSLDAPAVYQQPVAPLTTLQCAQCHEPVFNNIKANGGKHQLHCRECHETIHTYRPGKKWQDVVPQCATCHGEAHGPSFLACLACHADPHAPIASLVNLAELEKGCATCHDAQKVEVAKFPSAHTEVSCSECHHTKHGYKPDCRECHEEPHTAYVDNATCIVCHPVHSPKQISYPETTANVVCAGCHGVVAQHLESSHRKHSQQTCVFCHVDQHGYVPDCTKCHAQPHSAAMLKRFDNNCTECHGEPHALILPGHKD
ncbi:cytochrome C [bacterium]|nr:cytochrome C [bacterium]